MKKKKRKPGKNEFFDIKPLKDWGIIWFPISMAKISTGQSVKKCSKFIGDFANKAGEPKIGLNTIYCDFLYLNSNETANVLKERFSIQMINHKNGLKKYIWKARKIHQIQQAFHFETWGNLYLGVEGDFKVYLDNIKKIFEKDKSFQKYLKEDCKFFKRKLTKNQLNFFLEEHLMAYLVLTMNVKFRNEYVQGREKWILLSYPGVPPKAQIYLCQLNPFKFKIKNSYYGEYNLENKKFYDYNNINLETWNYE